MAYTAVWDETVPLGAAAANTIDDLFRALKRDLREREADYLALPSASAASYAADPLRAYGLKLTDAQDAIIYHGDNAGTARNISFKDKTGATTFFTLGQASLDIVGSRNLTINTNKFTVAGATGNTVIGGTLSFTTASAKIIPGATSLLFRDTGDANTNLTITDAGAGTFRAGVAGTTGTFTGILSTTAALAIAATQKFYLDGVAATGDTYISEDAGNRIAFIAGGSNVVYMEKSGSDLNLMLTSGARLKMGTGATHAYFVESGAGVINLRTQAATDQMIWTTTTGAVDFPSIGTTASAANTFLDASNSIKKVTSSLRYKRDLLNLTLEESRHFLFGSYPFSYISKAKMDGKRRFIGLGAEHINILDNRLVNYDVNGDPDGVMYDRIPLFMIPVLKDHEIRLKKLERLTSTNVLLP